MRSPARGRGRTFLIVNLAAAAALLAGTLASAQQPAPGGAAQPVTTPAAPAAGTAKKTPAKSGTAKGAPAAQEHSASYSVGLSMGEQLRAGGVTPDMLNPAQVAQGVHDALAGKATTDKDRENLHSLINSVGDANHRAADKFLAENGKKPGVVTTASGLQYKVASAGNGDSPKGTDEVTVNYRGRLLNGTEFDNSYSRGQPANFPVNRVIPGWTEALQLMKPGAKWELYIPPKLGYDLRPPPGAPIPPGSMLIFEVELLSVKAPAPAPAAAPGAPPAPQAAKPAAAEPPK